MALTSFWFNRFTSACMMYIPVVVLALIVALRVCDWQFMSRQTISYGVVRPEVGGANAVLICLHNPPSVVCSTPSVSLV